MRRAQIVLAASIGAALVGCGGGGGGSAGAGDGLVSQTINGNGVSATYLAKPGVQPQVSGSNANGCAFTGLFGVTFTSVTTNQAATLANTKVAFSRHGGLWVTDPNFSNPTPILLDAVLDTVSGTECYPAIHPNGRVAAISRFDLSINQEEIYFVTLDGASVTRATNLGQDCFRPAWNPAGTKLAFDANNGGSSQIYTLPSGGGTPLNVSNNSFSDIQPTFSRDGTKIYFWRQSSSTYQSYMMGVDGSNQVPGPFGTATNPCGAVVSPSGNFYYYSDGTSIFRKSTDSGSGNAILTPPSGHVYIFPTLSPDGKLLLFGQFASGIGGVDEANYDGSGFTQLVVPSDTADEIATPSWGPYVQNRQVIGSGGSLATGASGFIVGQKGPTITSLLAFNAVTPSTTSIVPQASTTTNTVFQLKGDSINKLAYLNDLSLAGTVIVPVSGVSSIGGALVAFDAQTGKVDSVIPYSPGAPKMALGKAGVLEYTGRFLGVWDGAGRNLAPHGAGFVSFDSRTGKLLGFRADRG